MNINRVFENFFYLALVGFSFGTCINYLFYEYPYLHLIIHNTFSATNREFFFQINIAFTVSAFFLGMILYGRWRWKRFSSKKSQVLWQRMIYFIRPAGLFFLFPIFCWKEVLPNKPIFFLLLGSVLGLLFVHWFFVALKQLYCFFPTLKNKQFTLLSKPISFFILGGMISFYIIYVSFYTLQHHYSLGTSAFDLGLVENLFWNSIHGHFMESSLLEGGANLLGFHTSFVYILLMPIYYFFPKTETLLIAQSFLIGLAALPLFLIASRLLQNNRQALLFPFFYLIHPAVGGVNFYDFHELSFAPLIFFSVFYCWLTKRYKSFFLFLILLLSIKESLSIIIFLFGFYLLLSRSPKLGIILIIFGVSSYFFLQKLVIPYFSEGKYSQVWYFNWYYQQLLPEQEGPFGLIKSIVNNPVYTLNYFLSEKKILYLLQIFLPLCFLCFTQIRGILLLFYGLLVSLSASRDPLYQLGFQYAFDLIPYAFIATLMEVPRISSKNFFNFSRYQILLLMFLYSCLISYHYGMFYPREHFQGGFRRIDFIYSEKEKNNYEEMLAFLHLIPSTASVTASESLVPHLSHRRDVQTLRYAPYGKDYYLIFRSEAKEKQYQELHQKVFLELEYTLIRESSQILLYCKKDIHH
ncbi:MAG: DUF2079 domain-containing protein [Planctomycetota bacterium]